MIIMSMMTIILSMMMIIMNTMEIKSNDLQFVGEWRWIGPQSPMMGNIRLF